MCSIFNKKHHLKSLIIIFILGLSLLSKGSNTITFIDETQLLDISSSLLIFEDKTKTLDFDEILSREFIETKSLVPNLGISRSNFWVKIPITNNSEENSLLLELSLSIIDSIEFYEPIGNGLFITIKTGDHYHFYERKYKDPNYLFDLNIKKGETKIFYLKVNSNEAIQLPVKIGSKTEIYSQIKNRDILSGIYFGIMLVMILYNLFIYFTVRDKSYLYYVIYITCMLLTQASLQGYSFQYLWPNNLVFTKYSLIILPSLSGITGMYFMNIFLTTKKYSKRLFNISIFLLFPYLFAFILSFINIFDLSQIIIQLNSAIISLYMLIIPIIIYRKGYKPAKYFIAAWSVFLLGVFIFIFKDLEILPFNNFTRYTMQIGSCIETILLSFALAARINDYKKEKEESQRQTFLALEEKEQLVREQNITLEIKVKERTQELNKTLNHLKETQTQLVDAEKMASLGVLTAGIAHEINNPINFVSSNIPPLRQDINDLNTIINKYEELNDSSDFNNKLIEIEKLKKELDYNYLKDELNTIVNGIENGASRTAEIVKSLKNFSRLDEDDLIFANINEGITSTLTLLKSKLPNIEIIKKLAPLPKIECYPGKLNQVFMNILSNAIHAVEHHPTRVEKGRIEITTIDGTDFIKIIIADNGIGIKKEVKNKIFDPFFTTKEVGEGTGLGLSIVYRIIESHHGKIEVNSEINEGTTFAITLPIHQKK